MALVQMSFFSQILGMQTQVNAILPEARHLDAYPNVDRKKLPVLYLLHGLSDDQTAWTRWTGLERYAWKYPLVIVMPACQRSFYTDMRCGLRYWTYLSEELPAIMRQMLPISDRRADTFAAGLSMGGYGALKLGLRCPESFAAVASLSGAVDIRWSLDDSDSLKQEWHWVFGSNEDIAAGRDELFALAEKARPEQLPRIFLCCGTGDFLYEKNLQFRDHLQTLGIAFTYQEKNGAIHEWAYWDEMIQKVLRWLPLPRAD